MKFVGHLDLMRYFQKAIRRSEIAISYSKGYSPHQQISFASPLGVGLTSDGEYLDMQLESSLSSKEMIDLLNEQMNDEIKILSFKLLPDDSKSAMSFVAAADYLVSFKDGYSLCKDFKNQFENFMNQDEIVIVKTTKKSQQEVNLKPYIYKYSFDLDKYTDTTAETFQNGDFVFLQISAGSVVNIKPGLIMEAFCKYAEIPFQSYAYQIHRFDLYADISSEEENRQLVSLNDLGQDIL